MPTFAFIQMDYIILKVQNMVYRLSWLQMHEGSGNEREIFYVMLDKSTYLKKLA